MNFKSKYFSLFEMAHKVPVKRQVETLQRDKFSSQCGQTLHRNTLLSCTAAFICPMEIYLFLLQPLITSGHAGTPHHSHQLQGISEQLLPAEVSRTDGTDALSC